MAKATKTTKKSVKKSAPVKKDVEAAKVEEKSKVSRKPSKKTVLFFLAVIILAALIYFFRGLFVAATVNGEVIPRWTLNQEIEKKVGEDTLNDLITKKLIFQDMEKNGITVTDEEVQKEVKKTEDALKEQGRTLEDALPTIGLKTRDEYVESTKIEMLLKKKFAKEGTVTDEEVENYLADNAEVLPADEDIEAVKAQIKETISQQKLQDKVQAWLQELQSKATINRFVEF